ncbi:ATP-binding cassette G family transporter ABCG77 [Toxoplasma gondii VAND]|uniref:ATP-binding cassette G family transporter ABCG77 n=2 Tax=Toxoplasma gondii TaxID=5811 RepID=A0A086PNZ9_TOXGO|nr:ATP-binding cassette G family transporter ABCG77 [Toxoplasma gondii VAND]
MPSHPNLESTTPPVHDHSGGQPTESLTSICQKKIADYAVPVENYWSTDRLSPVALDRETTTVSEPRPIPSCYALSTIGSRSPAAEVRNSSASRCGGASPPSPENGAARSGVVQVLTPPRVVTLHKEADDSVQMKETEQAKRAARLQVFIRFTNLTFTPPRGLARQSVKEWAKTASCTQSSRQAIAGSDSVSGPCSKAPPPSAYARPRQILFGLSGYFAPGEIVGILGPSGAGKSTFLSVLCGRLKKGVGGLIDINGEPAPARMKKIVGYVMQQEYFFGNLTVEETLMYTARLRLGKKTSFAEKKARVEEVINSMKLNKCRGTRVGSAFCRGLSGGELKRLNIANELLLHPSLFLLDEPTSGLDASISTALLDMLKQLTRANRCTTVCTIHQPNSNVFMRFDRVIFLKDGHIVYQGKPSDVCAYFSSLNFHCPEGWNIADYALHVISASDDENFRRRSLTSTTAAGGDPITGSTHGEQVRLEREAAQRSSVLARYRINSFEEPKEVGSLSADASSLGRGPFACRAARTSSGSDRTRETNLFGEIIGRQTREAGSVEAASELRNGQQPGETEKDDDKLTGAYGAQPDFSAAHGLEAVCVVKHFCDGPLRPPEESTASALSAATSHAEDADNHFLIKAYQRRINITTFQLRLHDLSIDLVKDPSEQKTHGCKAEHGDSQKCDCDPIKDYSGCGGITQHDAADAFLASSMIKSHSLERTHSGEDEPGPKSGHDQRKPNTLLEEGAAAETSMNSFEVFTATAVEATHEHILEPLNNKTTRQNVRSLDLAEQTKSVSGENLALERMERRNILSSIHSCGCVLNRGTPQRNAEFSAGAPSLSNAQAWSDKLASFPAKKMEWPGRKFSKRTSFLSFDEEIKVAMSEPSYFQQVWVLVCRGIRKELKGKSTTLDLVQAAVIGAVVGSLYFQSCRDYSEEKLLDRMGLLYFTTSYYSFGPAYMAFTSFPAERAVISRERSSKAYKVSCYLLAKTMIDLVVQIFTPSLWLAIVYPLVGLPSDLGVFMAFWAQLVLLVCIAQAIGQLIAAIVVDDARLGGLLLSVILISSSISSGFYVQQQRLGPWISWLRWLSFQNYAVTNFVIVTVGSSSTLSCSEFSSFPTCPGQPITAEMITRRFTTALSPLSNITLMICTWLAIKLMCYGVLKKSLKLKS